ALAGGQAASTQTSARVILGQNSSGEKISAAAQIQDIVACANARGANISLAPMSIQAQIPADETADITCAQAVLRVLKWLPDVVSHFDYSAQTPALIFQKRADLQTLDISSLAIKNISFKKRRDLKVESVCVNYEKTNTVNGSNFKEIERDVYPQNASIGGKNSLVLTVPLGGYSQKTQHQKVETQEIQTSSQSWWAGKVPFLNNPDISGFVVRNISRNSTLPRELTSGNIMDWMLCSLERDSISADIEYFIGGNSAGVESVKINLLATNARSTTYSRTLSTSIEEPVPSGLAQAVYEASNAPQTEGSCEIANAGGECAICKKIAYANELENACAVESRLDIFKNSLKIKFGPPKHLYPDDISELFRTATIRKVPQNPQIRLTGETSKDNIFKYSDSEYMPIVTRYTKGRHKLEIEYPDGGDAAVLIDPLDIDENDDAGVVSLKKMLIVENGEPRYAYFLMGEPFETE
ncbi:MAG: hypothetical protein IKO42_05200, partial [Opitutales bacterium]|nr:hypothetical protein [Opitutales bacterium]